MSAIYRHYKGNMYHVIGSATHSETLESLIVYEALEPNKLGQRWARPESMFHETVLVNGVPTPRFQPITAYGIQPSAISIRLWVFSQKSTIPPSIERLTVDI